MSRGWPTSARTAIHQYMEKTRPMGGRSRPDVKIAVTGVFLGFPIRGMSSFMPLLFCNRPFPRATRNTWLCTFLFKFDGAGWVCEEHVKWCVHMWTDKELTPWGNATHDWLKTEDKNMGGLHSNFLCSFPCFLCGEGQGPQIWYLDEAEKEE